MQVNTEKTKIVVFRKRGDLRDNESWIYKYTPIEVVNEFNYLGTVFKYTGSFVLNHETLVGKGLKALNCLFYITKKYSLSPKVMCQLFDAFDGSILDYLCEVWGFGKSKVLERIHLKFCKNLLTVKSSTFSCVVYGELGRYPLFTTRYVRIVKYWSRIAN